MSDVQSLHIGLHVITLLILVWLVMHTRRENQYVGGGVTDKLYTSGATMRRLAQKFSQPGQGKYLVVHNAEQSSDNVEMVCFKREDVPAHMLANVE